MPVKDGSPEGYYENFMVGFWASGERRAEVWGHPRPDEPHRKPQSQHAFVIQGARSWLSPNDRKRPLATPTVVASISTAQMRQA